MAQITRDAEAVQLPGNVRSQVQLGNEGMICRKEAKESRYWLRLIEALEAEVAGEREALIQEAQELMNIFGSIVRKNE